MQDDDADIEVARPQKKDDSSSLTIDVEEAKECSLTTDVEEERKKNSPLGRSEKAVSIEVRNAALQTSLKISIIGKPGPKH